MIYAHPVIVINSGGAKGSRQAVGGEGEKEIFGSGSGCLETQAVDTEREGRKRERANTQRA